MIQRKDIILNLPYSKSTRSINVDPEQKDLEPCGIDPKLIYRLIVGRNWNEVMSTLESVEQINCESFDALLHFACRVHPPLEVVKLLVEQIPSSITNATNTGKYAIHFAAEFGAPCSVIEYLAAEDPFSASVQDITGMTPTHHLCKYYSARHQPKNDGNRKTEECMFDALKALIKYGAASLNLEDMEEKNAIEYAIESGTDIKVLRLLQKACIKQGRKQKMGDKVDNKSSSQMPERRKEGCTKKVSRTPIDLPPLKLTRTGSNMAVAA